ncbi:MAG: Gfo/Idh/MocA family oxidoreductase [Verrucomicrobiota bacterium]
MKNNLTPIPIAIVGLGRAGWTLHLEAILDFPQYKIVSVADPMPDRRKEAEDRTGCVSYETIEQLLQETTAVVVVIATPTHLHYRDTLMVLNSGRHCILEKPMGSNFEEAREMVKVAREKNLQLLVNYPYFFSGEYEHLKRVVASGKLGEIFHLRVFAGNYARRCDWQTLKKNGGGQLNNHGTHMLSMIVPLLNSHVTSLYADLRNIKNPGDAEDHVHLVLKNTNQVTIDLVVSSAIAHGCPRWIICGKYGTFVSDGKKGKLHYYDPSQVEELSLIDDAAPGRRYHEEVLPWKEEEVDAGDPRMESFIRSFHQSVLNVLLEGKEPQISPENALEVVRVVELASKASENGSWLDEEKCAHL